ncbi:MAG: hypothetical protein ABIR62_06400 [Dokdonella sp.]
MWITFARPVYRTLLGVALAGFGVSMSLIADAGELTPQEAAAQAQQETDGKVLSVQTLNVGKRKVYRIKLLTRDGRVRVIQIAADQ